MTKIPSITDHKYEDWALIGIGFSALAGGSYNLMSGLVDVHETLNQSLSNSSKLIATINFKISTGLLMLSMLIFMMLYSKIITNYVIKRKYGIKPFFTVRNIAFGVFCVVGLYGVCVITDLPYYYDNAFMGTSLMIGVFTATRLIRKAGTMYGHQQKQATGHNHN